MDSGKRGKDHHSLGSNHGPYFEQYFIEGGRMDFDENFLKREKAREDDARDFLNELIENSILPDKLLDLFRKTNESDWEMAMRFINDCFSTSEQWKILTQQIEERLAPGDRDELLRVLRFYSKF